MKPLPEPMLVYCQLDFWEHISVNSNRNSIISIQGNVYKFVVYQNGGNFVQRGDELMGYEFFDFT